MDNSIESNGVHVGLIALTGSDVTLESDVFEQNPTGLQLEAGSTDTVVNNTIDGNQVYGVILDSPNATLVNDLITNSGQAGVIERSPTTLMMSYCDVYSASSPDYSGLSDPTGTDGNLEVNPDYFNEANGDLELNPTSPVAGAGTSVVSPGVSAPSTDVLGNPPFDDPNITGRGDGSGYDIGAYWPQQVATSNVDLATTAVSGPATGLEGQSVTVNWTVESVGAGTATGSWHDAVYLSASPVFTPDAILLGNVEHTGDLGPGQSYNASGTFTLPGVLPGNEYFLVRCNSFNEVFEGSALADNVMASATPVAMSLPVLTVGTPQTGQLAATGSSELYQVTTTAGGNLNVSVTGSNGNTNELFVSFGDVPTVQSFDARSILPNSANQAVSLANVEAGTYYVLVYGANIPSGENFTLTATTPGFSITSISPTQGSNTGQVTLSINGAQFDGNSQPQLVDSAGVTIKPLAVYYTDSGLISATFNLTGLPTGAADVQVVNTGGATETLSHGFNITAGKPGELVTSISAPSGVRVGRGFTVTVNYQNVGATDLLAPVLVVSGNGSAELSFYSDFSNPATSLDLIAINPNGPAGILPPGASGSLTIYGTSSTTGSVTLQVSTAQYPAAPIDYAELASIVKPPNLTAAQFAAIYPQLQAQIGTSWSGYVAALSRDATLLPPPLGLNYDLQAVFNLEVNKARAALSQSVSGQIFLNDTAHPLSAASIVLTGRTTGQVFITNALTDGSFLVSGLVPDTYDVSLKEYQLAAPVTVVVGSGNVTGVSIVAVPGGVISGSIVQSDSGAPLPNVPVAAVDENGDLFQGVSSSNGLYTIENLPAGTYDVQAGGGSYVETDAPGITITAGALVPEINLALATAATVTGLVLDANGEGLAGAYVVMNDSDGNAVGDGATTNASGAYTLTGLPAGTYSLQASSAGFGTVTLNNVTVAAGAAMTAPDITLAAAGSLVGVVTTQGSGAPVPFAIITADLGSQLVETTQANSDGSFSLPNLPPGIYTVTTAISGFFNGSATAAVVAGQTTTVPALNVEPAGSVTGQVTRQSSGAALSGVELTIFSGGTAVDYAVTDANGDYEIDNLADGTYDVTVGAIGSEGAASSSVMLSAASPSATANFVLAVIGSISGTTLASDGSTPVPDVPVTLYSAGNPLLQEDSDDNGNFQFLLLEPGTYYLVAADETAVYGTQAPLAITAGTDLAGVQLVASVPMVTGTVTDAVTGDPVAGAVLHISGAGIDGLTDTLTDASGNFQFAGPAGDQLTITSNATGYAYQTQQVTLPASGSTTLNFALTAGITLSGTVTGSGAAAPLANATVAVRNESGPLEWYTAVSDPQGNFLLDTLPAGTYDIVVAATGYQSLVIRGMAISGSELGRTFSLEPASISVSGV